MSIKSEHDLRRIRFWRRVRKITVTTVAVLVVLLLLLPSLIPSALLSRLIAQSLEDQLGRPVRVAGADVGWFSGVTLDELTIDRGGEHAGESVVHAEGIHLEFLPWQWPDVAFGSPGYLGRLTVARLDLLLVRQVDGQLDLPRSSAPPPSFKSVEVLDGTVDMTDEATGLRRRISSLRVAVRRIEDSDQASVTAGGRLSSPDSADGEATARVSLGGLFHHFDLNRLEGLTGVCDVDWDALDLALLMPALDTGDADGLGVRTRIAGQASFRLDESRVVLFEGNISSPQLKVGQATSLDAEISQPVITFSGAWNKTTGRLEIHPVQLRGAGSSVRIEGGLAVGRDGRPSGELTLTGTLNWNLLNEQVRVLGRAVRLLPGATVSGTAEISPVVVRVEGPEVSVHGSVDLRRTELLWPSYFQKPSDVAAVFTVDGRVRLDTGELAAATAKLEVNPPRDPESGRPPDVVVTARTTGASATSMPSLDTTIAVANVGQLGHYVPQAGPYVQRWQTTGPVEVQLRLSPGGAGQPIEAHMEAGGLVFQVAPDVGKAAGVPMTAEIHGLLDGEGHRPQLRRVVLTLDDSVIEWTGRLGEQPRPKDPSRTHLAVSGSVEARGIERWLRLARPMLPSRPSIGLVGNVSIDDLTGSFSEDAVDLDLGVVDATRASVEVNSSPGRTEPAQRLLAKQLGKMARGQCVLTYTKVSDELRLASRVNLDGGRIELSGRAIGVGAAVGGSEPRWPTETHATVTLLADDVAAMLSSSPLLSQALGSYHLGGLLAVQVRCDVEDDVRLQGMVVLDGTECTVAEECGGLTKKAGLPLELLTEVRGPRRWNDKPADLRGWFSIKTEQSTLICNGRASVDVDALRRAAGRGDAARAVRSLELTGELNVAQSEGLTGLSPWWRRFSEEHAVVGRATVQGRLAGTPERGEVSLSINATDAGFIYGQGTGKDMGVDARLDLAAKTTGVIGEIALETASLRIAGTEADAEGMLYGRSWAALASGQPVDFALRLHGRSDQLARLAQLVPLQELRDMEPQGGVEFSVEVARDGYGVELRHGEFVFHDAKFKYNQVPMGADGHVSVGRDRFLVEALKFRLDDSSLSLSADIARPFEAPAGAFSLTGPRVDLDRMLAVLGLASAPAPPPAVGIPPEWPALRSLLTRANLAGQVAFDEFHWSDETGFRYDWRAFTSDFSLAEGRLSVPTFKAVMLGGVVIGKASADLDQDNPTVGIAYAVRNLAGGEKLTPMIAKLFPNMVVEGQADQVYQADTPLFATATQPKYPVGLSQFKATRGSMSGPAAPEWLTDLLPGLKLTVYEFSQMESISNLQANGRADSVMLFEGSPYSLYIIGHTDPDGTADYTLGVDLFNSLGQSEDVRKLQQGWVPLMTYKGRIVNSAWVGQTVSFKLPHEVAYEVFLQRSLVARLLQQSGEARRPNFDPYDFKDQ
jgi:hypothetical protein